MTTTSIAPQMARRIEIWPIERLVPYVRNARTHSPEQVAQIAASIVEFGFNAPILVASDAGIVAGHGRLLAARKLGLAEVPVVVLDHLSETQRRAYIIADNRAPDAAAYGVEGGGRDHRRGAQRRGSAGHPWPGGAGGNRGMTLVQLPARPERVLVIQLDGKLPNLALMRIAAHHRDRGGCATWK
jgi:hypothetical protein